MRQARAAARCRRGVYAVEFGTVVTIFLVPVLMGAMELAWQGAAAVALDNAALKASRYGSLGRDNGDGTRSGQACTSDIEKAARQAGAGLLNRGTLRVEPDIYTNTANAVSDRTGNSGTNGAGLGGDTVRYRLTYQQPFLFTKKFWNQNAYTHTATIIVQNEPFAAGNPNARPCS